MKDDINHVQLLIDNNLILNMSGFLYSRGVDMNTASHEFYFTLIVIRQWMQSRKVIVGKWSVHYGISEYAGTGIKTDKLVYDEILSAIENTLKGYI